MIKDETFLKNELFYLVAHAETTPNDLLLTISGFNTEHHDFLVQKAFKGMYHHAIHDIRHATFNKSKFRSIILQAVHGCS